MGPQVSNDEGVEPDVVIASAGAIPTKESLAAVILFTSGSSGMPKAGTR